MNVIEHYDKLIDENNDPFHDPQPLRDYMSLWDGTPFLDAMALTGKDTVLEVGVGTGRIAAKILPGCLTFTGIDISPKTVERARDNLSSFPNIDLICDDFLLHDFHTQFDIVYSTLTLQHFADKQSFYHKVCDVLKQDGRFVLSIDKSQEQYIDMGTRRLRIYPDTPESVKSCVVNSGMTVLKQFDTPHAHIFVCVKEPQESWT